MRKYENVDIVATLGAVMEVNTEHYKSDFQYDIEMFKEAAAQPNAENTRLLWLSRKSGTECFRERDVYIKDTAHYNHWKYYADTKDTILAYAVEITGAENGKVKGNLYELDYRKQVQQLEKTALPPSSVTMKYEDGTERQFPYNDWNNRTREVVYAEYEHGKVLSMRREPENEGSLQQLLKQAREDRQKYRPAVFKLRSSRKPSIRAQLAGGKAAAAPQKAAAKAKTKDMEVSI